VLSLRVGFNRFKEAEVFTPLDVTSLGFPKPASQLQIPNKYPIFTFQNYLQTSRSLGDTLPSETYTAQGDLLKIIGKHSMKFGGEYHDAACYFALGNGQNLRFHAKLDQLDPQVDDPNSGNAIALPAGRYEQRERESEPRPYLSLAVPGVVSRRLAAQPEVDGQPGAALGYGRAAGRAIQPPESRVRFQRQSPFQVPGLDLREGLLFAGVGGLPRSLQYRQQQLATSRRRGVQSSSE
jgi:hypothetical protein